MDGPDRKTPIPADGAMLDEEALEALLDSPGFGDVLLDCFEQGIRDAVAADEALSKQTGKAA